MREKYEDFRKDHDLHQNATDLLFELLIRKSTGTLGTFQISVKAAPFNLQDSTHLPNRELLLVLLDETIFHERLRDAC